VFDISCGSQSALSCGVSILDESLHRLLFVFVVMSSGLPFCRKHSKRSVFKFLLNERSETMRILWELRERLSGFDDNPNRNVNVERSNTVHRSKMLQELRLLLETASDHVEFLNVLAYLANKGDFTYESNYGKWLTVDITFQVILPYTILVSIGAFRNAEIDRVSRSSSRDRRSTCCIASIAMRIHVNYGTNLVQFSIK
jgi:hypothetical protein